MIISRKPTITITTKTEFNDICTRTRKPDKYTYAQPRRPLSGIITKSRKARRNIGGLKTQEWKTRERQNAGLENGAP